MMLLSQIVTTVQICLNVSCFNPSSPSFLKDFKMQIYICIKFNLKKIEVTKKNI